MASSPPSIAAKHSRATSWNHKRHVIELALFAVLVVALAGVAVMLTYWPFRYREVHPLLEHTFRSKVTVKRYHRTYFPHPGYVAEGVTFYRHGDMRIPPLATLDRMTVVGKWTNLIFHPHELYEIRLGGLHVRIPPSGTKARRLDFNEGVVASSQQTIQIETIVADGTTLDFLGDNGTPPLRLQFPLLQVHNVHQGQSLSFFARVLIPESQGTVLASGSVGPFRTNDYAATPLSGTYSLQNADLSQVHGISGHASASGRYTGTFSGIETFGQVAIPDFRAASAHRVRLDVAYRVLVNGINGASSPTTFHEGTAYFPDVHVTLPGADAHLNGTFNLRDTRIHFTGKADLQRDISRAATGWKSALLKPLNPFFRHNDAGAIVSVAVTGTAKQPKIAQNLLHSK
jgi:hypothetical protein